MLKDYFAKDADELKGKKLWLFDMDGTIYNEHTLFDGTLDLLKRIVDLGGDYVFITNNSSRSLEDYVSKIRAMGIPAEAHNFFTSTQATVLYLKDRYPGMKVYCQGTKSMLQEFQNSGIEITEEADPDAEVVVVGFDTELTSEKLRRTCVLLAKGLPFIATNCDLRCPVSFGYIPDCGSICQMLQNATGREPLFIGKPEPTMVRYAVQKFGRSPEETVVVGDRLYTDIAVGIRAGVTSICVLTGEATLEDIKNGSIKPTLTFASVKDIRI